MLTSTGAYSEFHESRADALMEFAQVQFTAFERLCALNFKVTREAIGDSSAYAQALLASKETPELSRLSVALALPAIDRTLAYSLRLGELGSQAQDEMARLVGAQITGLSNGMTEGLVTLARFAPAGFGMAARAAKSVLRTAESALDSLAAPGTETSEPAQVKRTAAAAMVGSAEAKVAKGGVNAGARSTGSAIGGARARKSVRRNAG